MDAVRENQGASAYDTVGFMRRAREARTAVDPDQAFLKRGVNEGSGGEKKRKELMQMMLLEPRLCILDETDSGLDIDALQVVASGVNAMRSESRSFLLVTHCSASTGAIEPTLRTRWTAASSDQVTSRWLSSRSERLQLARRR